uniref:ATP-binding protein n=1 Tax=Effusibacillus pohliae TaxID=232270 RepID=UPI001FE211DC
REWFRLLIHMSDHGIEFYTGYPQDRFTGVEKALEAAYPECERHPVSHQEVPLPNPKGGYGGYFLLREKGEREGLPLRAFDARRDEWGDVLLFLEPGTWIDLVFSPASPAELKRLVKRASRAIRPDPRTPASGWSAVAEIGLEALREFDPRRAGSKKRKPPALKPPSLSELDPDEAARYRSLMDRFTGRERAFDVMLSVWSEHPHASSVVQSLATRLETMMTNQNGIRLRRTRRCPISRIAPVPFPTQTMIWTAPELANIFHLPDGQHRVMERIPHLERGQRSLRKDELTEGVAVGYLKHPLQQGRPVSIPFEQFTKHFVLTGMTGAGKSSTAVMMIQSLLDRWIADPEHAPGFSYFDPARETVATILTRLLKAELDGAKIPWEKVHYVYLGPTDYPLGLNLLHHEQGENIDAVAKEVLHLLKYAYAGDTPRMDRLVENALLTLLEDRKPHTILGIVPVLTDEDWRNRILPFVRDPIVRQFWEREVDSASIDPILNRLSPLLTNRTMRRMFGQKKWSLDLRRYMDEGHIFLWDLLNVSKENVKLAVGHIITQYHQTAKTRSSGAKVHILAVDEAHLVQIPVMTKIIAEDRKFGLCLGLITQYIGQFNDLLVDAITENVGTILTCTQGMKSAAAVSVMTAGAFDKEFLQRLPERVVAVYTKTKNESGRSEITTFTVESDPPYMYKPNGEIADHRREKEVQEAIQWALSKGMELQARDGTPAEVVDREIEEYLSKGGTLLQEVRSYSHSERKGSNFEEY